MKTIIALLFGLTLAVSGQQLYTPAVFGTQGTNNFSAESGVFQYVPPSTNFPFIVGQSATGTWFNGILVYPNGSFVMDALTIAAFNTSNQNATAENINVAPIETQAIGLTIKALLNARFPSNQVTNAEMLSDYKAAKKTLGQ